MPKHISIRIISACLVILLLALSAGCGGKADNGGSTDITDSQTDTAEVTGANGETPPEKDQKEIYEEKLYQEYCSLDIYTLLNEIDKMIKAEGETPGSTELLQAVNAYTTKEGELTDKDLIEIITNEEMAVLTRDTVLQGADNINGGNGISDQSLFEPYISQKSFNETLRTTILQMIDMSSEENKKVLENIIMTEDGAIVTRSLLHLSFVDPPMSLRISNEIINNYKNHNDDAIKTAVMVKAEYFADLAVAESEKDVAEEKRQFIEFCFARYDEAADDSILKYPMMSALIDMLELDAVRMIINRSDIESSEKRRCVRRNYFTFAQAINSSVKEDIEFVIATMESYPLNNLAPLMKEKLAANPEYAGDRLNSIIERMEMTDIVDRTEAYSRKPRSWVE